MLHEFIIENRNEIIRRCTVRLTERRSPQPTPEQLERGIPLFLDQIAETLRLRLEPSPSMAEEATTRGGDLLRRGFTIAQVVHDYGDVCQTITELAVEKHAQITALEFKTFNLCLDEAIAQAVTEYGRLREYASNERLGHLDLVLGSCSNSALLAYDLLKSGKLGIGGSTGAVLGRTLLELRDLIARELADVRIRSGVYHRERLVVRDLVEDVEVAATMGAKARSLGFFAGAVPRDIVVEADRRVLSSVLSNLLQNALESTGEGGLVTLSVRTPGDRVLIDFDARNVPGAASVLTLDLPRAPALAPPAKAD